jgi:hypothetical protein
LPKYTPELNDIEVVWHDLKAFNLALIEAALALRREMIEHPH